MNDPGTLSVFAVELKQREPGQVINMKLLFRFAAVMAVIISGAAYADDTGYQQVRQVISGLVPTAKQISVADSVVDGLLEVQIDSEILYVTKDAKILIQGRLYDLATRTDLTENSKTVIRQGKMKEINPDTQIVFSPDQPDYELIVFTDIDCGYCQRLHAQMAEYNAEGIAIRYMMFPRAGVGSHSYNKAVSVWCADDQRTALTDAKLGREPEPKQCDNPIAEQYSLGQTLGVSGTPALVANDGTMIPGYVPPKALRQRLDQMAAASSAE